jgi:hypothetical protein
MPFYSKTEQFHVQRVFARLGDDGVKRAFNLLLERLHEQSGFELLASSHGAFSAINLCRDGARCYAFRGTKAWIAWYFRQPALRSHFVDRGRILQHFAAHEPKENARVGEIWIKLKTPQDARRVLDFVL